MAIDNYSIIYEKKKMQPLFFVIVYNYKTQEFLSITFIHFIQVTPQSYQHAHNLQIQNATYTPLEPLLHRF